MNLRAELADAVGEFHSYVRAAATASSHAEAQEAGEALHYRAFRLLPNGELTQAHIRVTRNAVLMGLVAAATASTSGLDPANAIVAGCVTSLGMLVSADESESEEVAQPPSLAYSVDRHLLALHATEREERELRRLCPDDEVTAVFGS